VAIHPGFDVDDDLLAHVDAAFNGGRAYARKRAAPEKTIA
jgi:hypothetical protein